MNAGTAANGPARGVPIAGALQPLAGALVRVFASPKPPYLALRIVWICAVPVFIALYHDITRHYLWLPDWDIRIVYEAMLLNDRLPNFTAGQAGFGHFVLLARLFEVLKFLGVVDAGAISELPPPPASEIVFQDLVFWGRIVAVALTCALAVTILFVAQAITGSRFYAFLAALAFSGTQSLNSQVVAMRSDLSAVVFATLAILFILLATKRGGAPKKALAYVGLSAFFAVISMYAKASTLPLVLLVPAFAVAFAERDSGRRFPGPSARLTAGLVAVAVLVGGLALPELLGAMETRAILYNGLIAAYVVACLVAYRVLSGSGLGAAIAGAAAVVLGLSLAQLAMASADHGTNVVALANHIDSLAKTTFGDDGGAAATGFPYGVIALRFIVNLWAVAKDGFFNLCWVCRRPSMIYLLVLVGLVWVLRAGNPTSRLRAGFLMAAFVFAEAVLHFHPFNNNYRMYVEGLLLVTLAFYVVQVTRGRSPRTRTIVAVCSAIFAVWFWVDDVNRKMLYPTFAFHTGDICIQREEMPRIASHFDRYCEPGGDMAGSEAIKPWIHDTREAFLWTDRPWRTSKGFVWKSSPIAIPGN